MNRLVAGLVALVVILAAVIWMQAHESGRYAMYTMAESPLRGVLDTRTGTIYFLSASHETGMMTTELHPQTGEMVYHYRWSRQNESPR